MVNEKSLANLNRRGRQRTSRPRIYIGCMPCGEGTYVADLEHAHRWTEKHWERCKMTDRFATDAVSAMERS